LHIQVRDTGIGIPPDKLKLIFEAFSQADTSTTRSFGGTGLGLTISTRLVEMMQGRIWVESEAGKGSCFHCTVSLGVTSNPPRPSGPGALLCGLRVLVVDDNPSNLGIVSRMVAEWGMQPSMASSGQQALFLLRQAVESDNAFALIVTDVHMPEMDAFAPAILMLTSGKAVGQAPQHIMKPMPRSELRDAIMLALTGRAGARHTDSLEAAVQVAAVSPSRILLAEDNTVNQRLAVRILEKAGHAVVVANNGREALAALQAQPFDLVLMDGQMPEMDGFEATRAIRNNELGQGTHIPIIAMTAHAMTGDRERCLLAGMDDYIAKPIHAADLLNLIEKNRLKEAVAL
jgi:CheY-like chemotaxis protein